MNARARDGEKPKVLCVDDEPNVVEGLALHLERTYQVRTATSGAEGLGIMASEGPFAVVFSDLRMPVMDGIGFLSQVKSQFPDTARVLLTGQLDIDNAIAAVNEGEIFRFLTKPCPPEVVAKTCAAAARQYQLVTAERVLLQETLTGSIKTLLDVLALSNPVAFGRAQRMRAQAAELAHHLQIADIWQLEVAAMISQIGGVILPDATARRLYQGLELNKEEKELVSKLPAIAEQLVGNIPRLDGVRAILGHFASRFDGRNADGAGGESIPIGARILRITHDFDLLATQGILAGVAIDTMRGRIGIYDPGLLEDFAVLKGRPNQPAESREVSAGDLKIGMVLAGDVKTRDGEVVVPKGQEVTPGVLMRVRSMKPGSLEEPLMVIVRHPAEA